MSKQRKQLPEVSIFANNPFLEELLALRDSPEDEQLIEVSDTLWDLLEDVQLDARQRKCMSYAGNWVTRSIRRRGEPAFR